MQHYENARNGFRISTDKQLLDIATIFRYLSEESYWAKDIAKNIVERSIEHSLCFGVYEGTRQIGFARVITDQATFAYLADVFILPEWRGQGLSKWLMEAILAHPGLQGLRRWLLATMDAHGLYTQFGFTQLTEPERMMQRKAPHTYSELKQLHTNA